LKEFPSPVNPLNVGNPGQDDEPERDESVMFMRRLIQRSDSPSNGSCSGHRAANALPVKVEMNWAVPQKRPRHTANVCRDLLKTTNFIWRPNRQSRSFHIVPKFLRFTCSFVCSFI